MMGAALFNRPAVVRRLLRAGADAAARTADGKTALQIAKEEAHTECAKILSEAAGAGADAADTAAADAPLLSRRVVLGGLFPP